MRDALTTGDLAVRQTIAVRHKEPPFLLFVQSGVEYGHGGFDSPVIFDSGVKTIYVVVLDLLNAEQVGLFEYVEVYVQLRDAPIGVELLSCLLGKEFLHRVEIGKLHLGVGNYPL